MTQYIDKSALVAEIERLKSEHIKHTRNKFCAEWSCGVLDNILSFINTLEVKGVDLEREINKYISDNFFGSETIGFFANRTKEEPNDQDIALCAKHFFDLGLRAQKGE